MLKIIFTLDYEVHGNGEGCPYDLMVEPTNRLMSLLEDFGAKLTIMADVAEILKFREYKFRFGRDDYYYEAITGQLQDALRRGHDVQLHLHSSWFNSRYENGRWLQDWSEYNFAELSLERLNEVVRVGKRFLEDLLKTAQPGYECIAFRAANWAVSPSRGVIQALVNNGIRIDSSVFKHGRREGIVNFDYSMTPSDIVPWFVDANDVCRKSKNGQLMEFPIYSEHRTIGTFLTPNRVFRVLLNKRHRIPNAKADRPDASEKGELGKRHFAHWLSLLTQRHAWKADFNQCTGRQLIQALHRAESKFAGIRTDLPFVLIGHSKLFTKLNERCLRSFGAFVAKNNSRFGYATFGEFDLNSLAAIGV